MLERRFQQLPETSKDATKTLQPDMQATMSTVPEPTLSTLMEVKELWKSHIYDMYEQSFHTTEEDTGPMFVDDLDEEQTPVKTTPSADEIEA